MGEPSSAIRNSETTSMLDYGFNTYKIDKVLTKDKVLSKEKVSLGKTKEVEVVPSQDINILRNKTNKKRNITYKVNIDKIKAPIKIGDKVGSINIIEDNKTIMKIDATVNKNIDKANIFITYLRDLLDIVKGTN